MVSSQLLYYPTVTRETYRNMGRMTAADRQRQAASSDLGLPALDPATTAS